MLFTLDIKGIHKKLMLHLVRHGTDPNNPTFSNGQCLSKMDRVALCPEGDPSCYLL